ncbi:MAG TPA: hypothetical protein VGB75_13025 [Jatrophihabitans sp.]|jgi:hypothetical protein|uniref:hypothetical protein n=1 Tax=Jatrophihabitans sp. TaxID=1932789 RepID=UPI002EE4A5C4
MTWFRKLLPPAAAAPAPAPQPGASRPEPDGDDPATLRSGLAQLNRFINQNSGKLPGEAVVTARRVTDVLREVIDTSEIRPLDIYAVISVQGILQDYLPTTLRSFLALDDTQLTVARPSGRTPVQSLQEQLEALLDAATSVLTAAQAQDADALLSQGSFLRTKFSGSDLDL